MLQQHGGRDTGGGNGGECHHRKGGYL